MQHTMRLVCSPESVSVTHSATKKVQATCCMLGGMVRTMSSDVLRAMPGGLFHSFVAYSDGHQQKQ